MTVEQFIQRFTDAEHAAYEQSADREKNHQVFHEQHVHPLLAIVEGMSDNERWSLICYTAGYAPKALITWLASRGKLPDAL